MNDNALKQPEDMVLREPNNNTKIWLFLPCKDIKICKKAKRKEEKRKE